MSEKNNKTATIIGSYTTHRRTITETDVVTFVNVVGLHEPPFIDMEYIKENMPPSHHQRFAPAPFLISVGMGLVAPMVMRVIDDISEREKVGLFKGMVGVEARVLAPVYMNETLYVDLDSSVQRITSKGDVLIGLRHKLMTKDGVMVLDFTETALFGAPK